MKELNKLALKESFDTVNQSLDGFVEELEQERYQNTKEKVWQKLDKEYAAKGYVGEYKITGRVIGIYLSGPNQEEMMREFPEETIYTVNMENLENTLEILTHNIVESMANSNNIRRRNILANKFMYKSAKKLAKKRFEEAVEEVKKYTAIEEKYS